MKFAVTFALASILSLAIVYSAGASAVETATKDARAVYYPQGVRDGQAKAKAPSDVQTKVNGFCTGVLQLAWFDPNMNVGQDQVDAYAATSHECTDTRYLGSLSVTNYAGEPGTDYVFVITMHGKETWWVFTVTSAGLIADIQ
jgi:hypothetical protein